MKIMFVIHSLSTIGGAETILVRYANFFSKKKYEVAIISLSNQKTLFTLHPKIKLFNFSPTLSNNLYINKIELPYQQIKHISKSIQKHNSDIIISFLSATNILATISSKVAKRPIILSEHSSFHRAVKNNFWKILRRVIYPFADVDIILTKEDKSKYHFVKRVEVINNPLILEDKHKNIKREKIILSVGRLHPIKGFDMAIKAFSKIKNSDWKFIIAGEGKERKKLEKLIKELQLEKRVQLVGLIQDIEYYYKRSSIFLLSSHSEGFPVGLCEAMGYGCASIAFDCPTGPKEIIENRVNGLLIEPTNIIKLREAIEFLIENKNQRDYLAQNALKILDKLNMEKIGNQWEEIIHQVVLDYKKYIKNRIFRGSKFTTTSH